MVGRGQRSNHPACRTLLAAALVGRADLLLAAAPVSRADLKDGGWDKAQPECKELVTESVQLPTGAREHTLTHGCKKVYNKQKMNSSSHVRQLLLKTATNSGETEFKQRQQMTNKRKTRSISFGIFKRYPY